jgi:hypothetical protein
MFNIEIYQQNNKGSKTFSATATNVNCETSEQIATEIANFCKAHFELTTKLTKLGIKGQSKSRLKLSQPASFEITCIEDSTKVSFNVANFGEFVGNNLKNKKVNTAIELMVDFTQTFAHLWSA